MPFARRRRTARMPLSRRRRYGYSRRRRTRRSRYRTRPRSVAVRRPLVQMGALAPASSTIALSTSMTNHFNASGLNNFVVNANSPNKPFFSSSSLPRGFDQWIALYKRAMVVSFNLVIKAVCARNTSAGISEQADAIVVVVSEGSTPTESSWIRLAELPRAVSRVLPARTFSVARASVGGSIRKLYGVSSLDEAGFAVLLDKTGQEVPEHRVFASVFCQSFNTTSTCNTYVFAECTQVIRFFDPRPVSAGSIPSS